MNNSWIELTLMRNSKKIRIHADEILAYKEIILGSGCIVSLTKTLEMLEDIIVNESQAEIDALICCLDNSVKRNAAHLCGHLQTVQSQMLKKI